MRELALIYIKRCSVTQGTDRFEKLYDKAQTEIMKLDRIQREPLLEMLSSTATSNGFEELSEQFEVFYLSAPQRQIDINKLDDDKLKSLRKNLVLNLQSLTQCLKQLSAQYSDLHRLESKVGASAQEIIECYDSIENIETDYAEYHKLSLYSLRYIDNHQRQELILSLMEVTFSLISERSVEYAWRFFPKQYSSAHHALPIERLLSLLEMLVVGHDASPLEISEICDYLDSLSDVMNTSPAFFDHIRNIIRLTPEQNRPELVPGFDYVLALYTDDLNLEIAATIDLQLHETKTHRPKFIHAVIESLKNDPVIFHQQLCSSSSYPELVLAFANYRKYNQPSLHKKILETFCEENFNLDSFPLTIFDTLNDLESFYYWAKPQCENSHSNNLIWVAYQLLSKMKLTDEDMVCDFVKEIREMYYNMISETAPLFSVSPSTSAESLADQKRSPQLKSKKIFS